MSCTFSFQEDSGRQRKHYSTIFDGTVAQASTIDLSSDRRNAIGAGMHRFH
jgi:hypothetical protein